MGTGALDELIERLSALPPEKLAEYDKKLPRRKFVPNPGPQTEAYLSKADILLYGGQAGGGKSALICGLALCEHERSLIMRRRYADLSALSDELVKMHGSRDGFASAPRPRLRTAEKLIEFGAAQYPGDEQSHQGQAHDLLCVGRGTPVLMADGSYKPIEEIQVGDAVMTLEGQRMVERVHPIQKKPCVCVEANGFSQIQSTTHPLLTPDGWTSAVSPACACEPKLDQNAYNTAVLSGLKSEALEHSHKQTWPGQPHTGAPSQEYLYPLGRSEKRAYEGPKAQGIDCVRSDDGRLNVQQLPLWFGLRVRLSPCFRSAMRVFARFAEWCGVSGVQKMSEPQDLRYHYSSCCYPCGERTPVTSGLSTGITSDRLYLHQLVDAGQPTPNCLPNDDLGGTREYTHVLPHKYDHPYTKETRQVDLSCCLQSVPYSVTPVGEMDVFDLQIEEVNHYITYGGFVNKNCFDEVVHFNESQVRFLLGWVRSTKPGQRCRVVMASNPPVGSQGTWIIKFFAPWLDPSYPDRAKPGELRWVITDADGDDMWVDGPDPVDVDGKMLTPLSRTFIPASTADNPFLANTDYAARLDALPEPLRSALRDGNFMAAKVDQSMQVIPTSWVIAAQSRWTPRPPVAIPQCAIGVDCGGGGKDSTIIAPRHDGWYDTLVELKGSETPNGEGIGGRVMSIRKDNSEVVIDAGGGYGNLPMREIRNNNIPVTAYKGAEAATGRTADGQFGFYNKRSQVIWRFREALDPSQPGGSPVSLPDDPALLSDLTAPTYEYTPRGIKVEGKEDVVDKLGRSPDRGDAVCLAWSSGPRMASDGQTWLANKRNLGNNPTIILGHNNKKKRG